MPNPKIHCGMCGSVVPDKNCKWDDSIGTPGNHSVIALISFRCPKCKHYQEE